jgi:hypothetical protein
MACLLFEVWQNAEDNSVEMSSVAPRSDDLRRKIAPNSVLRHSFRASSDFKAYQLYYDWNGWGTWKPEPDWSEHTFTEEEAREQERYLRTRNGG